MSAAAEPETAAITAAFAPTLVAWQREHGRQTLPWQQLGDARDAYRVWLAEIMLQQTQVAAVVPYYRRFLERFPDVATLAAASSDDVMQAWSGLGYYSRARNLHAAAKDVVARFGGVFPAEVASLASLPGIGRSTAGAIAAFAYGTRAAILDGNVRRVLSRVFGVEGLPAASAHQKRLWALSEALLPERDIERYTQGLMDLGATVCTPRNPACLICPFGKDCIAHREGREAELPERAPRRAVPERRVALLLVQRGGAVLLERRPPVGIWGGLWSLPEHATGTTRAALAPVLARLGTVATIADEDGFVHGFTHFVLHADVVRVTLKDEVVEQATELREPGLLWAARDRLDTLGLPAPIRTLLARSL